MINMGTAVFHRVVEEARQQGHEEGFQAGQNKTINAAIQAVAKTMMETTRFGLFSPEYILGCATDRVSAWLAGKGW